MNRKQVNVGIVGATGLVGKELLKVLEERDLSISTLRLWASEKSAGSTVVFDEQNYKVEELKEGVFDGSKLDFIFFAAGGEVSERYVPEAADSGAFVIDNSSFFRMDPEVPLVVPEVNPHAVDQAKDSKIIANPNCSTIQMIVALKPLHDLAGLKRVIVSTYQAVSGAGKEAMDELETQVGALFSQTAIEKKVFPHQIAFNCIPQIDVFAEDGYTKEEWKMMLETPKIMSLPDLKVSATCVRVPVFMCHSESVTLEFEKEIEPEAARLALDKFPGVQVWDDPKTNNYPLNFNLADEDDVFVGRIRKDRSVPHGLHLWVVADNLRKGAATNAVQIAETCVQRQLVS